VVCDAGGPYSAERAGPVTMIPLDGSGSSGPDPPSLVYEWTTDCPGGFFDDPNSPTPIIYINTNGQFPMMGSVYLTVSDGIETSSCSSTITISDTTMASNETGSLLVYPLIDNINYSTIVEISNRADVAVWLAGFMIVHASGNPTDFEKNDFLIHLTQKDTFWWNTSLAYNKQDVDGIYTQIQGFQNKKGFMFVWAVEDDQIQLEIEWNYLEGNAVTYGSPPGHAFQYNALPHQVFSIKGDRVLNLDGKEYSKATSQILVEGFSEDYVANLDGKWVVCSLNIDFINSIQPEFNINLAVWNQYEVYQSRHLDFNQFQQYDLKEDLNIDMSQIFTPKWQFATSCSEPIWAIFYQTVGSYAWGGNVWQYTNTGIPVAVILPPVPQQK